MHFFLLSVVRRLTFSIVFLALWSLVFCSTKRIRMTLEARPKALFLSHGGGPGFFMKGGSGSFGQMNADSPAAEFYRTFTKKWAKPSAVVIISAHWETRSAIRVTSAPRHPLFYDYYGFPPHTYELGYDCPGHPALAQRVIELLRGKGLQATGDEARGYDHGVFIPLKLMYPEADIPVVQVSLLAGLSADQHLKIGAALRGLLQDEGVLIVGSGQATHNMHASYPGYPRGKPAPREGEFMSWLKETATDAGVSPEERRRRLSKWKAEAPYGLLAHPREEHLLPLHVVAASVGFSPGEVIFDDFVGGGMSLACLGYWVKEEERGTGTEAKSNTGEDSGAVCDA